jgi:hypothetical protein
MVFHEGVKSMLRHTLSRLSTLSVLLCGLSAHADFNNRADGSVRWEADAAILAGSGCVKDVDAFVIAAGNDLSVIFSDLGFSLGGNSGAPLAARKNCSVRVPATIAKGLYIGELTQQITYGVTKTSGSQGAVATRSTFFGFPVSPYTVNIPYGRNINQPFLTNTRKDRFLVDTVEGRSWISRWCALQRNPRGLYQANLAVSGQKDSDFEDLILFVDGLDLKYEVRSQLVFCGVPN